MSISWGAQYPKLKTNLRLAINRLRLMGKKKTEMALKARTEIADYIAAHKDDRARIRVEHIIREDYLVEAFEILEMYCDLLLARFGLIEQMKTLDDGIAEAVISILWAAPRIATDIAEFKTISDQLTVKYGKPFAEAARGNQLEYPAKVSPKLIMKLSAAAPPKLLVERYMIEIAASAGVPFIPDADVMRDDEVTQAEKMLIDFKQAGNDVQPPTQPIPQEYGWNMPPPPDGFNGSGGPNMPPPPPPHFFGGGGGNGGGHIYEVPSGTPTNPMHPHPPPYDSYNAPAQNSGFDAAAASSGVIQLPKIGPNGLPVYPGGGGPQDFNYPPLNQQPNSVEDKSKPPVFQQTGGPSAPPQSLKKPVDDFDDIVFPDAPTSFVGGSNRGGGNGGGGGGNTGSGDLDFDELAKRFDQLKKK